MGRLLPRTSENSSSETVRKVPEVPETGPHETLRCLVRPRFRPIRRPNPRSESRSNPFSDSLGRVVLRSSHRPGAIRPGLLCRDRGASWPDVYKTGDTHRPYYGPSQVRPSGQRRSTKRPDERYPYIPAAESGPSTALKRGENG